MDLTSVKEAVLSRFFFTVVTFKWNYEFFSHLKYFFKYLFSVISRFNNFNISFYIISNSGVTASFVARYITTQLALGNDVKDIIGTLRLEFRRLWNAGREKFSIHSVNKVLVKQGLKSHYKPMTFAAQVKNL